MGALQMVLISVGLNLVVARNCFLNLSVIELENQHAHIYPNVTILKNEIEPHTVLVFTCKRNTRRYTHQCSSSGKWDITPGETNTKYQIQTITK